MRRLRDLAAEDILTQMEARSSELLDAEEAAAEAEGAFKAYEAVAALAFRDAGSSMAEAERRVRADDGWVEKYTAVQSAHIKAAQAKRDYQRAEKALDLWRTERASLRTVEKHL